jgi:hypothetical protein
MPAQEHCVFCGRAHQDTFLSTPSSPHGARPIRHYRKICHQCLPLHPQSVFKVRRPVISGQALAKEIVELMEHYFNSEGFTPPPLSPPDYLIGSARRFSNRGFTTCTEDILRFIVGEEGQHIAHPFHSQDTEAQKAEKNLRKAIQRFSEESL